MKLITKHLYIDAAPCRLRWVEHQSLSVKSCFRAIFLEFIHHLVRLAGIRYHFGITTILLSPVSHIFVIVIFIWWSPFIPSRNLDEVFTYNHIWMALMYLRSRSHVKASMVLTRADYLYTPLFIIQNVLEYEYISISFASALDSINIRRKTCYLN